MTTAIASTTRSDGTQWRMRTTAMTQPAIAISAQTTKSARHWPGGTSGEASAEEVWRVATTIPAIATATASPAAMLGRSDRTGAVRAVPGDRPLEPCSERRARMEAELALGAGRVELAP